MTQTKTLPSSFLCATWLVARPNLLAPPSQRCFICKNGWYSIRSVAAAFKATLKLHISVPSGVLLFLFDPFGFFVWLLQALERTRTISVHLCCTNMASPSQPLCASVEASAGSASCGMDVWIKMCLFPSTSFYIFIFKYISMHTFSHG